MALSETYEEATMTLIRADQVGPQALQPRALEASPGAIYLAGLLSEGSRRVQKRALDTMAEALASGSDAFSCPWEQVRFVHVCALKAWLAGRYAPATVNRFLSALRGALRSAWRLSLMTSEQYRQAGDVPGMRFQSLPAGRAISAGELYALMGTCAADQSPAGPRDAAIVALLYSCGLRRAELAALDLADYDPTAGSLQVRRGKGNKQRIAYLVAGAAEALSDWLTFRGDEPGALFWAIRRGGHLQAGQRLTTAGLYAIVQSRAGAAGIRRCSPHDFRRSFVSDLLDQGVDLATVARLAGHANIQTTARYDRRPEAANRRAVEKLHVPYFGRRTLKVE